MIIQPPKALKIKYIYIAAGVVLVVLLSIVWLTHHYQLWPFQADSKTAVQQVKSEKDNSDATNDQTKAESAKQSANVDVSKTTSEIPVSKSVSIQITQLAEDSQNQNITYSAEITNPGTSGTCSAVFTNTGSKPVTQTTTASGSSCGPVSIPSESFDSLGNWLLTLRYYTSDTQAVATKTIEIK
jgi:cytoskeletal protein RodZ